MVSDLQEFPTFIQRAGLYCASYVTKLLTSQPALHVLHNIFKVCGQSSYLDTYILSGIWQGLQSRTDIRMTHGAMMAFGSYAHIKLNTSPRGQHQCPGRTGG